MRAIWALTVSPGPASKPRVVRLIVYQRPASARSYSMRWLWKSVVLWVLRWRLTRRGAVSVRMRISSRSSLPGVLSRARSSRSWTCLLTKAHQTLRRSLVASTVTVAKPGPGTRSMTACPSPARKAQPLAPSGSLTSGREKSSRNWAASGAARRRDSEIRKRRTAGSSPRFGSGRVFTLRASELVADLAQKAFAPFDVSRPLDALGPHAVDDPQDGPALIRLGHDDLGRVGRGAVDAADLGHGLDRVQDVDREAAGHEDQERVAGAERQGVLLGDLDQGGVVPGVADQGQSRRFAEGDAELHLRRRRDDGLVEVLDGLDEMGLAEDEIHVLGLVDGDDLEIHGSLLRVRYGPHYRASPCPVQPIRASLRCLTAADPGVIVFRRVKLNVPRFGEGDRPARTGRESRPAGLGRSGRGSPVPARQAQSPPRHRGHAEGRPSRRPLAQDHADAPHGRPGRAQRRLHPRLRPRPDDPALARQPHARLDPRGPWRPRQRRFH